MTKFILVGGYHWHAADGGKAFAREVAKDLDEPIKILICLFARKHDDWSAIYEEDSSNFAKFIEGKVEFQLANPDNFAKQIDWADAIFLRGGENHLLKESLNKTPGWQELLLGKVLAGSSAGANIISKYYYSPEDLELGDGFGLLPIKVLVHYKSNYNAPHVDWDKALQMLKEYKEDLELITLPEGEFVVIESGS